MRVTSIVAVVVVAAVLAGDEAASARQSRDQSPRPPGTGTAVLAGRVVREGSPVARARVAIDAGDGRVGRQTVSDDQGRFAFESLPPGRYLVTASKAGWVTTYYGSPRPGRPPGVRVAVAVGARVAIDVPFVPGGVIAGKIVAEDGRPMARQYPWLLEQRIVGDRRMLARVSLPLDVGFFERSTDDRGEFRLFGLPPGTYYLVVNPSISSGARITTSDEVRWATQPAGAGAPPPPGPLAGYASLYFPGTPDPGAARPIVVGPGEVRDGLEFRVSFAPVARLSGTVRAADGSPAPGATVELATRERKVSLEGSGWRATADREGRFAIANVPPGDYRLSARAASAPQGGSRTLDLWGQSAVVVAGRDVDGVAIALAPASTIAGRIAFDATTLKPPEDLTKVRLQFIGTGALAVAMTGAGSGSSLHTATVAADGAFLVEGLPPDRYVAAASWPGMRTGDGTAGWWLTTIGVGGNDLGDAPIDVPPNASVRDVAIGFRDRVGSIEGELTDAAGQPAPEYFVLAFSVNRASWTSTSRRAVPAVRPATDGRFRITGLLPGDYYLAVVTAIAEDEHADPAFLEALLSGAIRVSVGDGQTVRQSLRIK
jgi:hypothetical protein